MSSRLLAGTRVLLHAALVFGLLVALPVLVGLTVEQRTAFAHPGNTDGAGCHTCRTNCTESWGIPYGFYHTHVNGQDVPCGGGASTPTPTAAPPPPTTTVPVDRTPPAVPVASGAPTVETGSVKVTVSGEAGGTLRGTSNIAGELFVVPATGGPQLLAFDVPVGVHTIAIVATDAAGNASGPLTVQATYAAPTARAQQDPRDRSAPLVVKVTGPANGSAKVTVGTVVQESPLGSTGTATMLLSVPDGDHTAGVVVADRRGATSSVVNIDVTVDTTAPNITIKVDKNAAKDGDLDFTVKAEKGADLTVTSKKAKLSKSFTAKSRPRHFTKDVDKAGKYVIAVTATDEAGNTSEREVTVKLS